MLLYATGYCFLQKLCEACSLFNREISQVSEKGFSNTFYIPTRETNKKIKQRFHKIILIFLIFSILFYLVSFVLFFKRSKAGR